MRASVPLVVACFALLTALALLQIGGAATALRPNAAISAGDPTEAMTRLAVNQFYAAVNVLLITGDPTLLDTAVDQSFVDHVDAASEVRNRITLITDLLARRRSDPDLQFDVAAVVVDGDQALAYVQTDPFAATAARRTTMIDALRVRDGVVIERWSDNFGTAIAAPTSGDERSSDGSEGGAVRPPEPTARGRGDGVRLAPFAPTAMATLLTPRRFPRTQK